MMWDLRTKLILGLCLFTSIYLTAVDCRVPRAKRALKREKEKPIPDPLAEIDMDSITELKIPNWEFCMDMYLRPEDHNLVLPWWYHYCQDVKTKNPKQMGKNMKMADVEKYIQDEVDLYKKRMNSKNIEFSELEKDLIQSRQMEMGKKK